MLENNDRARESRRTESPFQESTDERSPKNHGLSQADRTMRSMSLLGRDGASYPPCLGHGCDGLRTDNGVAET